MAASVFKAFSANEGHNFEKIESLEMLKHFQQFLQEQAKNQAKPVANTDGLFLALKKAAKEIAYTPQQNRASRAKSAVNHALKAVQAQPSA